jgi:hypothetical protein
LCGTWVRCAAAEKKRWARWCPLDTGEPSELRKRFYPGLAAAAGLELRAGRFRVLPEFRYTRWTANISPPGGLLRFASNQVEFLAGVLF